METTTIEASSNERNLNGVKYGGDKALTGHLSSSKTPSAKNGLHLIELLAKGALQKHPKTQAVAKAMVAQTNSKALLLKTTSMYLAEHEEGELVSNQKLYPPANQCTWYCKVFSTLTEQKRRHQPSYLRSTMVTYCMTHLCNGGTEAVWVTKHSLTGLTLIRWNPCLTLFRWPRT